LIVFNRQMIQWLNVGETHIPSSLHFPTRQSGRRSGASIAETVTEDKNKKKGVKGEKVKRGNGEKGNFASWVGG
jgi:hypothetical protein